MMSEGHSQNLACHRRLPPFGRALDSVLKAGRKPTNSVFCFVGSECWHYAKYHSQHQPVLALPPGDTASDYYWPVNRLDCLIARVGDATRRDILLFAHELLTTGARRIVIILVEDLFGKSPVTASSVRDAN